MFSIIELVVFVLLPVVKWKPAYETTIFICIFHTSNVWTRFARLIIGASELLRYPGDCTLAWCLLCWWAITRAANWSCLNISRMIWLHQMRLLRLSVSRVSAYFSLGSHLSSGSPQNPEQQLTWLDLTSSLR